MENTRKEDKFLQAVLAKLQGDLTSAQWRVRESSCVGLSYLLGGRTWDDALDILTQLWQDIFRVMDDPKESVRIASAKAAQSLSRVSIKMCDASNGARSGGAATRAILPPLLEAGLTSTLPEVRTVCLTTLMRMTSGFLLTPHIGVLIAALLQAAGEMEEQPPDHTPLKLGDDQEAREKQDEAGLTTNSSASIMGCIYCVMQYVDSSVLPSLVPRLVDITKSNPSATSRRGAAHVIATLIHQAFTGRFLSALLTGLSDRSPAIMVSHAECAGHLMKTAKDSSRKKQLSMLRAWYIDKEGDANRAAVTFLTGLSKKDPAVMIIQSDCIGHIMRTADNSSKRELFNGMRDWYLEKGDDASKAAAVLALQAVDGHNPDAVKIYTNPVRLIDSPAMNQERNSTNTTITNVGPMVGDETIDR